MNCNHALSSMIYRVASHSNGAKARNYRSCWTCKRCLDKAVNWCSTTASVRVHFYILGRKTEIADPREKT